MKKLLFSLIVTAILIGISVSLWRALFDKNALTTSGFYDKEINQLSYAWDPATDKYWVLGIVMRPTQIQTVGEPIRLRHSHISSVREFCCLRDHLLQQMEREELKITNPELLRQQVVDNEKPSAASFTKEELDRIFSGEYSAKSATLVSLDELSPRSYLDPEISNLFGWDSDVTEDIYVAHLVIASMTGGGANQKVESWAESIPRAVIFSNSAYFALRKAGAKNLGSDN